MAGFSLFSKANTAKEIRNNEMKDMKIILKDVWIDAINNDKDCVWYANTELGKKHLELIVSQNISEEEIKEHFLHGKVFCFSESSKYPSDFQIKYFGYMIDFVYKRLTKQRLLKMKALADKLDCYLVDNFTIVSDDKYLKLLEKTK